MSAKNGFVTMDRAATLLPFLAGLALAITSPGCRADHKPTAKATDYKHPLPEGTKICGRPDFNTMFPYSIRSATLPVLVHYYKKVEKDTARRVLAYVEKGWEFHVKKIGMREVIGDGGDCGPDDSFDVFVWKGHRSCVVDQISENPRTPWDDRGVYRAVDPWGPYGGAGLEKTVVHEMAHASQAADDWYESPIMFEMSAVFLDQVYANSYIKLYLNDFQLHPDWALDRDDKYDTWYMYGASMYLLYLKDRFFDGDSRFLSRLWLESRNPPGAQNDQKKNEPDFVDVLDRMLKEKANTSYEATVPEFSRWRWYTGEHVDDRHFSPLLSGKEHLQAAKLALAAQLPAQPGKITISKNAPMMHGTSYLELSAEASPSQPVYVSLEAPSDPTRRFVVQAVPGLTSDSDGEVLDLATGPKLLKFNIITRRHLSRSTVITTNLAFKQWERSSKKVLKTSPMVSCTCKSGSLTTAPFSRRT